MSRTARFLTVVAACSLGWVSAATAGTPAKKASPAPPAQPALMQQMVGTWSVQQRMWPGAGEPPVPLPAGVAHRRLIGGAFLEEVTEAAKPAAGEAFTRTSYFDYNAVSHQYEYFSLDTRAPQMMNERSERMEATAPAAGGALRLNGGSFVAPEWGKAKNVAFTYRLTVGAVDGGRQVVQLYLTPQGAAGAREFLAFEYVYVRSR